GKGRRRAWVGLEGGNKKPDPGARGSGWNEYRSEADGFRVLEPTVHAEGDLHTGVAVVVPTGVGRVDAESVVALLVVAFFEDVAGADIDAGVFGDAIAGGDVDLERGR